MIGVEVAVGASSTASEFVSPINVNFEHKKLFPGDIGPVDRRDGHRRCSGASPTRSSSQTLEKMEAKLARGALRRLHRPQLHRQRNGIYPLEFTARFGYPTISIQQEGLITPIGELLYELAEGTLTSCKARSGFQVGVRIVVPPFPYDDPETFESTSKDAVILFKTAGREGVHIEDVKLVNGEWVVAGTSGVVLIVCGIGTDHEAGPAPGLQPGPERHDPEHVLPRRHRRPLVEEDSDSGGRSSRLRSSLGVAGLPVRDESRTSPSAAPLLPAGVTDCVAITPADSVPRLCPTAQIGRVGYLSRRSAISTLRSSNAPGRSDGSASRSRRR